MEREQVLERIRERFGEKADIFERSKKRVYVTVPKEEAPRLCRMLFEECGGRLVTATGVDTRPGIEVIYHFCFDEIGVIISVRTLARKPFPELESLGAFLPAAQWIEREIHDLLGVNFKGHPDLRRLILPDDWPEGEYPLRRKEVKE